MPSVIDLTVARAAKRFARYSDEELAATVQQVAGLPLSGLERELLSDIRAEIARRTGAAQ